jgi:ABC-type multidrug transport system ATPase subunit
VRFDGVDVYENLSTFRSVLGYVPQDDIIDADLPLSNAHSATRRVFGSRRRQPRRRSIARWVTHSTQLG